MTRIVIKPKGKLQLINITEILRYRELFYIFTWRDIKVRYKQTFFGVAWVIFQPLAATGIFTIFFGRLAKIPSDNMPYELFAFIGLTFWIFFSGSLTHAANSMVENLNIIKKVYFPKEILPIAASVTSLVDLAINLVILVAIALFFGFSPSPMILIVTPIVIIIAVCSASRIV